MQGNLPTIKYLLWQGSHIDMEDVDVVVIGAGPAGLSAAKTLRAAGSSFKLLQAMDCGGRAWTSVRRVAALLAAR
jgi:cation diffusion facilitator CzcD-associated flavoprotein CzcO